ncbi:hypothetical protein [Arthrobacter sp. B3I4]|uniref:hypothetical protein n=1 Tax=Arthrobacter sp. B3I4 TaxID=3042267 RepID=UPI00278A023C|nr:hypothetical protein [Arthrobacter sp. B3I4]MDQ0754464.1 hypothetical protein [Arthrobacter sp. B3I4]
MGLLPAKPARPQPHRLTRAAAHAVDRLRKARIPFRPGEVVVGDDPFNGRRQGTVEVIRPPYLGLRVPGTPVGTLVFFDYRTVRHPE